MKKNTLWILIALPALWVMVSCNTARKTVQTTGFDGHTSQNALDWDGTYRGLLPCADCPGLLTALTLTSLDRYVLKTRYLGNKGGETFTDSGTFAWDDAGQVITLESGNKYFVGENQLTQLDRDGNKVTGSLAEHYLLAKVDGLLLETYWKLTTIGGGPLHLDTGFHKEPFLMLKQKESRAFGNAGCNQISGSYTLDTDHRLRFSKMISTMMACSNMKIEQGFMDVLEQTDHYAIQADTLILLQGERELARFISENPR